MNFCEKRIYSTGQKNTSRYLTIRDRVCRYFQTERRRLLDFEVTFGRPQLSRQASGPYPNQTTNSFSLKTIHSTYIDGSGGAKSWLHKGYATWLRSKNISLRTVGLHSPNT